MAFSTPGRKVDESRRCGKRDSRLCRQSCNPLSASRKRRGKRQALTQSCLRCQSRKCTENLQSDQRQTLHLNRAATKNLKTFH
jgi:hypothetical protein